MIRQPQFDAARPLAGGALREEPLPTGTALVPVTAGTHDNRDGVLPSRGYAPFLAQLIATAQRLPQTRRLRRATLPEVSMAYRNAARLS